MRLATDRHNWFRNRKFHHDSGPAIIYGDGERDWYYDGLVVKQYYIDYGMIVKMPELMYLYVGSVNDVN